MKAFADLTEQEILALAISSEEDDSRTYLTFAHQLMEKFPASAKVFIEMAEEEQTRNHTAMPSAISTATNLSTRVHLRQSAFASFMTSSAI